RILCLSITYSVCCCFCCRPDLLSFPTRRSSDLFTRDLRGGRGGGIVDRRRRPAAGGAAGAHRRALWTGEDVVSDALLDIAGIRVDRKSTRLNSSHVKISYAVFCLKKKKD